MYSDDVFTARNENQPFITPSALQNYVLRRIIMRVFIDFYL